MVDGDDVAVRVVAGCLFEVSLPAGGAPRWRFDGHRPEVTLLAEAVEGDEHRFRFRAEAAGAVAGAVELRFRCGDRERAVVVPVAPEADLDRGTPGAR